MCVFWMLVTSSLVHFCSGDFVQTLVGKSVTLVSSERCLNASKGSLVHVSSNGGSPWDVAVAVLVNGRWSPKTGYEDRLTPGGAVELNETLVNDCGLYELNCSTITGTVTIQVEVLNLKIYTTPLPQNTSSSVPSPETTQSYHWLAIIIAAPGLFFIISPTLTLAVSLSEYEFTRIPLVV